MMDHFGDPERIVGTQEAAKLVLTSRRTIVAWIRVGVNGVKLSAERMPGWRGAYRIRVADLKAMLRKVQEEE